MPTYDYLCEANGRVLEVQHRMNDSIATWGELCACNGIDAGNTPADAPVKKLATGGNVVTGAKDSGGHTCSSGPCCGGGMCSFE